LVGLGLVLVSLSGNDEKVKFFHADRKIKVKYFHALGFGPNKSPQNTRIVLGDFTTRF